MQKGERILINNKDLFENPRNIPMLYKYMSIQNLNFVKEVLNDEKLYLINANKCNDPYDSSTVVPSAFLEDMKKTFQEDEVSEHPDVIQSEQTLMSCFSEYSDSIVMWSHYTYKHEGIVIEFDFSNNETLKSNLIKVVYTNLYNTDNYYYAMLTKSREWEYEQEWRIIGAYFSSSVDDKISSNSDLRYLNIEGCVKSIRFGVRTPLNIKKELAQICNNKGIQIFNAKLNKDKYKIDYVRSQIGLSKKNV